MGDMPNGDESADELIESANKKINEVKRVVGFALPDTVDSQRKDDGAEPDIDESRISKIEADIKTLGEAISNLSHAVSDVADATIKNSDSITKNGDSITKISDGLLALSVMARKLHGAPQASEPDVK